MTVAILWNQNCQVREDFPVRTCTIGSVVAVGGVPSSRGVGPAGVGVSASRSSSAATAVSVVDGGAFLVGEQDAGEHALEVAAGLEQLGFGGVLRSVVIATGARHPVRALLEEAVGAPAAAEVVVLPRLARRRPRPR